MSNNSTVFNKVFKLILVTVVLVSMQACVSKANLESQAVIELNNNLAQLNQWQLKGKIAWITPKERKSAYISWQQNQNIMQFDLNNLLGINLASMNYNGSLATLDADGQQFQDPSPSFLIYKITGWQVPIESLGFWIKGATTNKGRETLGAESNLQSIERYENGLVKQIKPNCNNCDQWTIDYKSYTQVIIDENTYQLPKLINLYNPAFDATIKISVSKWSE